MRREWEGETGKGMKQKGQCHQIAYYWGVKRRPIGVLWESFSTEHTSQLSQLSVQGTEALIHPPEPQTPLSG